MDFYDPDGSPIVTPHALVRHLTRRRSVASLQVEPRAVVAVLDRDVRHLIKHTAATPVKAWHGLREVYRGTLDQEYVTIARSGFGAPSLVALAEELAAFGTKSILFFGYCGSLQHHVKAGDLIVPTEAVREEGTSYHYLQRGIPARADATVLTIITGHLAGCGVAFHKGTVWTTDAIYRETNHKVARFRTQGVLAVEMELSALFAFGAATGIATGALLVVSDELTERVWHPLFFLPRLQRGIRKAREMVLEILPNLS